VTTENMPTGFWISLGSSSHSRLHDEAIKTKSFLFLQVVEKFLIKSWTKLPEIYSQFCEIGSVELKFMLSMLDLRVGRAELIHAFRLDTGYIYKWALLFFLKCIVEHFSSLVDGRTFIHYLLYSFSRITTCTLPKYRRIDKIYHLYLWSIWINSTLDLGCLHSTLALIAHVRVLRRIRRMFCVGIAYGPLLVCHGVAIA